MISVTNWSKWWKITRDYSKNFRKKRNSTNIWRDKIKKVNANYLPWLKIKWKRWNNSMRMSMNPNSNNMRINGWKNLKNYKIGSNSLKIIRRMWKRNLKHNIPQLPEKTILKNKGNYLVFINLTHSLQRNLPIRVWKDKINNYLTTSNIFKINSQLQGENVSNSNNL